MDPWAARVPRLVCVSNITSSSSSRWSLPSTWYWILGFTIYTNIVCVCVCLNIDSKQNETDPKKPKLNQNKTPTKNGGNARRRRAVFCFVLPAILPFHPSNISIPSRIVLLKGIYLFILSSSSMCCCARSQGKARPLFMFCCSPCWLAGIGFWNVFGCKLIELIGKCLVCFVRFWVRVCVCTFGMTNSRRD